MAACFRAGKVCANDRGGRRVAAVSGSRVSIRVCDNVVDHAESPKKIVGELARILAPGGLLYFTVNIHHRVYAVAAGVHSSWRAVGVPFEVGPFADHTTHLTLEALTSLSELAVTDSQCEEQCRRSEGARP